MKSTHWSKKGLKELKKIPFSQLTSLRPLTHLQEAIEEVCLEVKKKLPLIKLSFYPSDEWFCVDGTLAIAIPFYLYHPLLWELEKKEMGKIEEENQEILKRILRHEIGHAVDNAYNLRACPQRQQLFGSSDQKYPKFYSRKVFSQAYAMNLPLNYAQAHPDEDFAETFATWLNPQSDWKRKYQGKACYNKLLLMNSLMNECKKTPPLKKSRRQYDKVTELKGTLQKFYQKRKKIYLSPLTVVMNNKTSTKNSRLVKKDQIILKLKNELNMPNYQIKAVLQAIGRCDELPLKVWEKIPSFIEHQFERIPL